MPVPHHEFGGKRICCRFRSIDAHVARERPELCRIEYRKGLSKSDDGCYSQRRSANKRRSDRACPRIGFTRDSKAPRRDTGRSLTRKTLRRSQIFLRVDQFSETSTHQRWQTDKIHHGELRTDRCPGFNDKLFKLSYTLHLQHQYCRKQQLPHGIPHQYVPEHRDAPSSSRELSSEPRAKVVSGTHSIYTHFPKD